MIVNACDSAYVSRETGRTNAMHNNSELRIATLPPCSSNDSSSEVVPAPTQFVRRQNSKANLAAQAPCVNGGIPSFKFSQDTAPGVGAMWSFLGPLSSSHGMQSKHYAANRKYVATLLTSSDAGWNEEQYPNGWDDAMEALS